MDIRIWEIKKLLSAKILLGLMGVFIVYNFFAVSENFEIKNDLKIINGMIDEVGTSFDEETYQKILAMEKEKMQELNQKLKNIFGKEYASISELFESKEYDEKLYSGESFTEDENLLIREVAILNMYSHADTLIECYEKMDFNKVAKGVVNMYGLSGDAEKTIMDNYSKVEERFNEVKANGDHKDIFFMGETYKLHQFLFRDIFKNCIIEIAILVSLAVAYLVSYERDRRCMGIVLATKRGRNLIKDKLLVGILASIVIAITMLSSTLIFYFINYDYSGVWNSSISSAFNVDVSQYITWYDFSFKEYLIAAILVVIIISILIGMMTFVVCNVVKSSYKTFALNFLIYGLSFMTPDLFSQSSSMFIYANYNLPTLILNPHMWFVGSSRILSGEYYLEMTLIGTGILLTSLLLIVMQRFKKENI